MIRTILFDFGNVLAFFDHGRALEKLKHHTTIPPAELAIILYGGELELAYECGQISTQKYLTCSLAEFTAAFVDIFTENSGVTRLIPQLEKKYRLVLASNTNEAHFTHYRKQFMHCLDRFDHLVVSHEVGARKPARAFYEQCQRHAHCEPEECLFVDDLHSNIHAAEAFGWNGIVLTTPEDLETRMKALGVNV